MTNSNTAKDAAAAALEALLKDSRIGGQLPAPTDPAKVDSFLNSEQGMQTSLRVLEVALEAAKAECLVDDESVSGGIQIGIGEQAQPDLNPAEETASMAETEASAESSGPSTIAEPLSESSSGAEGSSPAGAEPIPDTEIPTEGGAQVATGQEPDPRPGGDELVVSSVSVEEDHVLDGSEVTDLAATAEKEGYAQSDPSDTESDTDQIRSQPTSIAGVTGSGVNGDSADVASLSAPDPVAVEDTTMNDGQDSDQLDNKASARQAGRDSSARAEFDSGRNARSEQLAEYARTPATAPAPDRRPVNPPKLRVELPNSKEGVPYSATPVLTNHGKQMRVDVVEVHFPTDIGLRFNPETGCVEGTPTEPGDHRCTLIVQRPGRVPVQRRTVDFIFVVNFDPKSLWKEIDPSPYAPFQKPHMDSQRRVEREMELIAASRRGRSHANNGTFRDDDFKLTIGGDYYLVSVADGAGSATYSREGSRITVNKFSDSICAALD